MCGGYDVCSLVSAQLSMPFALATAMLRGGVGLQDISAEGRSEASISYLMDRISLEMDQSQSGGSAEPRLVQTNKGIYRRQAVVARGAAANRLSDAETRQKFADLAGTRLATVEVESIADQVLALEDCGDIREWQLLTTTSDEPTLIK